MQELTCCGTVPQARFYSTLCGVPQEGGHYLYVLVGGWEKAGEAQEFDLQCSPSKVMHILDSRTWRWGTRTSTGTPPAGVVHHASVTYKGKVLVFGVCDDTASTSANRIATYDPTTASWTSIAVPPRIAGRTPPQASHTAVSDGTSIYIFGGNAGHTALGDLWQFSPESNQFTLILPKKGDVPSPRQYHASCYARGSVWVYGGAPDNKTTRADDAVYADLWRFDVEGRYWELVVPQGGRLPSARGSVSAVFTDPFIYIFGGFDGKSDFRNLYRFDVDLRKWAELPVDSNITARWGHSAAPLPHSSGFVTFGGYSYLTETVHEDVLRYEHPPPSLRYLTAKRILLAGMKYKGWEEEEEEGEEEERSGDS